MTRAARRVGRSTPAMSRILGRLRAQFGDPLLVRAGRSMVLTPRAEAMKPRVNDAVAQARLVMKPSDAPPLREVDREYVVAGSDYVLTVLGAALDAVVRDEAPQLRLRFIPNAAQDAEALRSGAVDLAVGIYGVLPPELRQRPLLTDRFVCVARAGHPYAREPLSLDRYLSAQHIQVAPRGQPGGYIDDVLAERGRARRVRRAVHAPRGAGARRRERRDLLTVSERVGYDGGGGPRPASLRAAVRDEALCPQPRLAPSLRRRRDPPLRPRGVRAGRGGRPRSPPPRRRDAPPTEAGASEALTPSR